MIHPTSYKLKVSIRFKRPYLFLQKYYWLDE